MTSSLLHLHANHGVHIVEWLQRELGSRAGKCGAAHIIILPWLLLLDPRREKAFQNEVVRNFGVEVLQRATDAEILTYLLQLVQVGSSSLTRVESRIAWLRNGLVDVW